MENLQELTECCICTEIFTDPRMLPCIHTFCLKCLQQIAVKNEIKVGEKMPCPLCRREFVIPTEGMSGLRKNFFMDRMLEITILSKPVEKATHCEICIEENETEACEIPTATNYCIQCRKDICNLCCRQHRKFHKGHELLPLGYPMREELIRKCAAQSCDKHSKEKAELFCSDCKEVLCKKYCEENHQLHKCTDIEASADSFRQQILNTVQRVSSFPKSAELKSERVLTEKSEFMKKVEREESAVISRGKILKDLVDKCTQSLLDELKSIKQSHLQELETAKEEKEFHKGILERFKEYCRELVSKGSSAEICRSAFNINTSEVELKQMFEVHNQMTSAEFSFEASKLEELWKTENVVGKINVEKKSPEAKGRKANVTETSDDGKHEVSILSSAELDMPSGYVIGVTKLMHSIYILSWSSFASNLYVFDDQSPFRLQREIEINEFNDPEEITAIEESKCLYVTDKGCIWEITTDAYRVKKWVIVKKLNSFSAFKDGHLLVITEYQSSRSYLKIYKSGVKLICFLLLPINIKSPLNVIQTSNGEFIIIHRNGQDGPWVLSRLTSNGKKIIRQFNLTVYGVSPQPNSSWHLSLDSDKNRLFLAEYGRVSVFDSNSLILIKVLLTLEKYDMPKLHYDAKKKQLFVAQSRKVNVYEIN